MLYLYIACDYFLCANSQGLNLVQGPNLVCPPKFQGFGACGKTLVQCMCSYCSNLTPAMNLK